MREHEQSGIFESKGPRRGFLNAGNVMFSYTPYVVFAANDEVCRHAMSNYACHPIVSPISKMHDVGKSSNRKYNFETVVTGDRGMMHEEWDF